MIRLPKNVFLEDGAYVFKHPSGRDFDLGDRLIDAKARLAKLGALDASGAFEADFTGAFWSSVSMGGPDECWPWAGPRDSGGYGYFGRERAHRLAWRYANLTPIAPGALIRHHCDNPPCCNPRHLAPGTGLENTSDRVRRQRSAKGEANGRARLSEAQVLEIAKAVGSYAEIGRQFGVSKWTVADVKTGASWAWLTGLNSHGSTQIPMKQRRRA